MIKTRHFARCADAMETRCGIWRNDDAYLFHITSNHPFLDGNKRAGAMAAFVFLDANGYDLTAPPDEFEQTVLHVASGTISKDDLTEWFRSHSRPRR